jgi:glutamate/tyrosine decarboxylase-like PLP-dependent enzyme
MLYDFRPMPGQLDSDSLLLLHDALAELEEGFVNLPDPATRPADPAALRRVLLEVAGRMRDNYPYYHPQYAGQMLKPPHAVARLAYALAMWINPNNHALDGGRASSAMEKEAVAEIASMFGWATHLGHLTGGGTMANLEALWVAGQLKPGSTVLASSQAHYTHSRISAVLKLPFEPIATGRDGRMDLEALEKRLEAGGVGIVVATLGTTAVGSVDPLPGILALRERYGFRLHADCAYGGYYALARNLEAPARAAFDRLGEVDSIVIDPHKHGLQPYGCGCVLFRDPAVGTHYRHDSPYTYFSSKELHLGEISLECSRPGAAAVALWATQRLYPLARGGEFASMLEDCRAAALEFHALLARDPRFITAMQPELDIVVWAVRARDAAESSVKARATFERAAKAGLHLALAELPAEFFGNPWDSGGTVTALRAVLMKPEHRAHVHELSKLLDQSAPR